MIVYFIKGGGGQEVLLLLVSQEPKEVVAWCLIREIRKKVLEGKLFGSRFQGKVGRKCLMF